MAIMNKAIIIFQFVMEILILNFQTILNVFTLTEIY